MTNRIGNMYIITKISNRHLKETYTLYWNVADYAQLYFDYIGNRK